VVLAVAAVALVAVPAITLRLVHLNMLGFNTDEAVYAGQAASIAGDPQLHGLFPAFRAHPLLFQMLVSVVYQFRVDDLTPRLLAVAFGLATIVAGYAAGAKIYGRRAGLLTALFLAVMPYLVVVNRQGLLDGPMVFFSVTALWLMAKFVADERPWALYAAGAMLGLAFNTKETAVLLVPAVYAFIAVTPSVRVRLIDVLLSFAAFFVVGVAYPLSSMLGGGTASGKHFLIWQLFRPPNHEWSFYLTVVPSAIGIPVVLLAVGALVLAAVRRRWSWRESLLVCWILVPVFFFQLWPTKGFQYLLPIAPSMAVLAAGLLCDLGHGQRLWLRGMRGASALKAAIAVAAVVLLVLVSWTDVNAASRATFLAGTGGVPGGRQAGLWIHDHAPAGAKLLAIGPSMANILQFYGHREALGLSVSPNPLHRNPAYTPVVNPDLLLRNGEIQYVVWDAYSAARSSFFSQRIMTLVRRYDGSVAHVESVTVATPRGPVRRPVIVIYAVRP
jgi:4-amino-4-deoxy-L-arabinose transferase-like glycosyltransferase